LGISLLCYFAVYDCLSSYGWQAIILSWSRVGNDGMIFKIKVFLMTTKPTVTLHIGTEKTGTTTIQEFLFLNKSILLRQNVFIPAFLGPRNHRWAVFLAEGDDRVDSFTKSRGLSEDKEKRLSIKSFKREELFQKTIDFSNKHWVISSEFFQSRLTTELEIRELKKILLEAFSSVNIVIYVREPIRTAIATWSTMIKAGGTIRALWEPGRFEKNNCDHKAILSRWLNVFDKHQITVRLFDRNSFENDDLLNDFCKYARITMSPDFAIPAPSNQSLSFKAILILSEINKSIPNFIGPRKNYIRGDIVKYIENCLKAYPGYIPTKDEVEQYAEYYSDSTDWIKEQFFPMNTPLWTPSLTRDCDDHRFEPHISHTERDLALLVANIWNDKSKELLKFNRRAKRVQNVSL